MNITEYHVDVLILGGGPAGTWAAIAASAKGATVLLADKGYCGTSGATAPNGTAVWNPMGREKNKTTQQILRRVLMGHGLTKAKWLEGIIGQTHTNIKKLEEWGYPFPKDVHQNSSFISLQGPEYMKLMRRRVKKCGVIILDQSPALGLLTNSNGAACGAHGINRQTNELWTVHAGAVVMATGGCAFKSNVAGCLGLTGDGLLMSAEIGAELSGMEFSNKYSIAPIWSPITKSFYYNFATFYKEDGTIIDSVDDKQIAKLLLSEQVYLTINKADEQTKQWMKESQPTFWLSFDRTGINPFIDKFPITMRLEGSVRGTGGVNIKSKKCDTSVNGLFAAGDVATRELVAGATSGGGGINASWAISSGFWAGEAAASYSQHAIKNNMVTRLPIKNIDVNLAETVVREEVIPLNKNFFRDQITMEASLDKLNNSWNSITNQAIDIVKNKETQAMVATARWMYSSAMFRNESRGLHFRTDHPTNDSKQVCRYIVTGVNDIVIKKHD
jgi:aspartate oxidase